MVQESICPENHLQTHTPDANIFMEIRSILRGEANERQYIASIEILEFCFTPVPEGAWL